MLLKMTIAEMFQTCYPGAAQAEKLEQKLKRTLELASLEDGIDDNNTGETDLAAATDIVEGPAVLQRAQVARIKSTIDWLCEVKDTVGSHGESEGKAHMLGVANLVRVFHESFQDMVENTGDKTAKRQIIAEHEGGATARDWYHLFCEQMMCN